MKFLKKNVYYCSIFSDIFLSNVYKLITFINFPLIINTNYYYKKKYIKLFYLPKVYYKPKIKQYNAIFGLEISLLTIIFME